jgi:phosphatidylinositol-4,5-bisphosphate 3-kinase
LSSAKRPLWLVWANPDPLADIVEQKHEIIFKNGDDLRQDMLTLSVMRVMDSMWKMAGKDFQLSLYNCLPMGKDVRVCMRLHTHSSQIGMIQVVKKSRTFGDIGVLRANAINDWIHENNPDKKS